MELIERGGGITVKKVALSSCVGKSHAGGVVLFANTHVSTGVTNMPLPASKLPIRLCWGRAHQKFDLGYHRPSTRSNSHESPVRAITLAARSFSLLGEFFGHASLWTPSGMPPSIEHRMMAPHTMHVRPIIIRCSTMVIV